ncbi:MAG: redox-regulated ATPase YchF [Helicobacter sp.]|nr:redox-regulated ATPase YchF [Helicobacter sp.]
MGLKIGIIGLPNVGKSSTFNALTKAQNAQSANYPFCTIEPNIASVPLPDNRLKVLAKIANPQNVIPSTIDFVDIAGLVRGASKGEGLGNQFLSHIKEVDLILHLVRAFEDTDITHVEGSIDPIRDIEIIDLELILADITSLNRKIERLKKQIKTDKNAANLLNRATELMEFLESGKSARAFLNRDDAFLELDSELRLLSNKNVIFGINVSEAQLGNVNQSDLAGIKAHADTINAPVCVFCAKLEEELLEMEDDEKITFLEEMGYSNYQGLSEIVRLGFKYLGLINYFTVGVKEVRSWTIRSGVSAPKAASVIHNDFEKGFIRAQVIGYDDFVKSNGEAGAKSAGLLRIEGKDYVVQDGDVMHFLFNV